MPALRRLALLAGLLAPAFADILHIDGEAGLVKEVDKGVPLLVEFFAPWCPHCQHYQPQWAQIANLTRGRGVTIGSVDCTVHKPVCSLEEVKGYPTILAYNIPGVELGEKVPKKDPAFVLEWLQEHLENVVDPLAARVPLVAHVETIRTRKVQDEGGIQTQMRLRDAVSATLFALAPTALDLGSLGLSPGEHQRRQEQRTQALEDFLYVLAHAFPEASARRGFHALYHEVTANALGPGGAISAESWRDLREGWTLDAYAAEDYPACTFQVDGETPPAQVQPYACGLWTLMHLLAESGPTLGVDAGILQLALRNFIAEFFDCTPCRDHFLAAFDACGPLRLPGARLEIDRCLLRASDAKSFPLWLWDMHNVVSRRVYQEAGGEMLDGPAGEGAKTVTGFQTGAGADQRRQLYLLEQSDEGSFPRYYWPDLKLCKTCWQYQGNGQWSASGSAVSSFLETAYSLDADFELEHAGGGSITSRRRIPADVILVVFALLVLAFFVVRGRSDASGVEVPQVPSLRMGPSLSHRNVSSTAGESSSVASPRTVHRRRNGTDSSV